MVWGSVELSLAKATVLALIFAILEVGYTSTCICTNALCEAVRAPIDGLHFAPIHALMALAYVLVAFAPYRLYMLLTGKKEPRLIVTGLAIVLYCYLAEDFLWHVLAWACGVQPFPTFCEWARWPLEQLPFPWWYPPAALAVLGVILLTRQWLKKSEEAQKAEDEFRNKVAQLLQQYKT